MGIIELYLAKGTWFANFSKANNAEEIYRLFGSYSIPTAYTDKASTSRVRAMIQVLNPSHTVTIEGD